MPVASNQGKPTTAFHRRVLPFFTFDAEWAPSPPRKDYQTCIHRLRDTLRETTQRIRENYEIYEQLAMVFLIVKDLEEVLYWGDWGSHDSMNAHVFNELWGVKVAAEKLKSDTSGRALERLVTKVEQVGKACLEGWFY